MSSSAFAQCCKSDVLALMPSSLKLDRARPPTRIPRAFSCFTYEDAAIRRASVVGCPRTASTAKHDMGLLFALSCWRDEDPERCQEGLHITTNYSIDLPDVIVAEAQAYISTLDVFPLHFDLGAARLDMTTFRSTPFRMRFPSSQAEALKLLGDYYVRQSNDLGLVVLEASTWTCCAQRRIRLTYSHRQKKRSAQCARQHLKAVSCHRRLAWQTTLALASMGP